MLKFDITNWYWFIGGDNSQVFSSKTMAFVALSDANYQAWLALGNKAATTGAGIEANLITDIWKNYQTEAQNLLDKSDITAIRCIKAGVAFPSAWQTYVKELRAIVAATSGDVMIALPVAPAYPVGT